MQNRSKLILYRDSMNVAVEAGQQTDHGWRVGEETGGRAHRSNLDLHADQSLDNEIDDWMCHFEMGFLAKVKHVQRSAKKGIKKRAEDRAADLQRVGSWAVQPCSSRRLLLSSCLA